MKKVLVSLLILLLIINITNITNEVSAAAGCVNCEWTDPEPDPEPQPEDLPEEENKSALKKFIDTIFATPMTILALAHERLQSINAVTAQGLNVGQYLAIFGDMPAAWQLVISSLLLSLVVIGSVFLFRSIMRLYYAKKEEVQWW